MYFPYVRGRQYELLALRELVATGRLSQHIIPILEPVKLSSTLSKTIEEFISKDRKICLVCNPAVGSFSVDMKDDDKDTNKKKFLQYLSEPQIIKAHIFKKDSSESLSFWEEKNGIKKNEWYIINNNREYLNEYLKVFKDVEPQMSFIPDDRAFKRGVLGNITMLEDRFNKCNRNSDYLNMIDEFFSDDHLFYNEEGFEGFSDYSVIGEDYLESGFAPYAVAIHIVYFDSDRNLRVHHFVSKSNSDIQNPAGKFYEAVSKLNDWILENNNQLTRSLDVFIEHYKNQTYPGLGSVKKLSLMHHLETIGKYLDEVK